jgi:hypothetical protein
MPFTAGVRAGALPGVPATGDPSHQAGITLAPTQRQCIGRAVSNETTGPSPTELSEADLFRELRQLHDTRHTTLRHGSDDALRTHTDRLNDLEQEYLRRRPEREVDPARLRDEREAGR